MTSDDALTITAMIAAGWPGAIWEADRLAAYARGLEPLEADLTTQAVLRAQRELKYRPSVAELIEFVKIERRMAEPDSPIERALNNTPSQMMPPWVRGFVVSRVRYNDFRVWPEQHGQGLEGDVMTASDCNRYMSEGADLPIDVLFRAIVQ